MLLNRMQLLIHYVAIITKQDEAVYEQVYSIKILTLLNCGEVKYQCTNTAVLYIIF